MNQSQQQQQHKIKVEDGKRVQRILDELNAKHAASGKGGPVSMDETAKQMFIDYANELTISVLEASSLLAQHRNSKTIDAEDVNAILYKKLGIEFPGVPKHPQVTSGEGDNSTSGTATPGV